MREYEVIGLVVTLHPPAVIGLTTEDQLRRRRSLLRDAGGGRFEALASLQFKRGERFQYDGDLPKDIVREVEPSGEPVSDDAESTAKKAPRKKK